MLLAIYDIFGNIKYILCVLFNFCFVFKRRQKYAWSNWRTLNQIVKLICDFGYSLHITPPQIFQVRGGSVKTRAVQKSNQLLAQVISWMGKYNNQDIDRIITDFLIKYKNKTQSLFGIKRFQLNENDSGKLQNLLHLNNNQMRILQRFVRDKTNAILLCNEHKLLEYQRNNELITTIIYSVMLQVSKRFVNTGAQMPIQELPVYTADSRDAIARLLSSILNAGKLFFHPSLPDTDFIRAEYGIDGSNNGIQHSWSVTARNKSHGKYGSLVTTLTHEKVDEKYINYLEIAKLQNNRNVVNQLLLWPNLIIIAKTNHNCQNVLQSSRFIVFPMIFTPRTQHFINNMQKKDLVNIDSPAPVTYCVNTADLPKLTTQIKKNVDEVMQIKDTNDNNSEDVAVTTSNKHKIQSVSISLNNFNNATQIMVSDVNETDIKNLPCVSKHKVTTVDATIDPGEFTMKFWIEKQHLLHLPSVYIVELPSDFKLQYPNNNTPVMRIIQRDFEYWAQQVIKGETMIWVKSHKSPKNGTQNNDNSNCTKSKSKSKSKNKHDILMLQNDYERSHSVNSVNSPIYDPTQDIDQANDSEYEAELKRKSKIKSKSKLQIKSKKTQIKDSVNVKTFSLRTFRFNKQSAFNRFAESFWEYQTSVASTQSIQNNELYFISWSCIVHVELNDSLPRTDDPNQMVAFNLTTMFDDHKGVDYCWIPKRVLPPSHDDNESQFCNFVITHQNLIVGIIVVYIEQCNQKFSSVTKYLQLRQCKIICRCPAYLNFGVDNCAVDDSLQVNYDQTNLFKLGSTQCVYNVKLQHQLQWWKKELYANIGLDNKGKNMVEGMSTSACTFPCACCDASNADIHAIPTPQSMTHTTRTAKSKQHNLQQGIDNDGNVDLKKSKGVQNASIYHVPPHKWGTLSMHNFEGIFAVAMDSFRDMLCQDKGHVIQWKQLQSQVQDLQTQYEKIVKLQVIITQTKQSVTNDDTKNWLRQSQLKLNKLVYKYRSDYCKWENMTCKQQSNAIILKFVALMEQYSVNLYYFLKGSIQGKMCGRIIIARNALIDLVDEYFTPSITLLWKHYLHNLSYLYIMLKHKSQRKWTIHECATLKHAYIDWKYQHILICALFRRNGSIGIKSHYLMHDIEKAMWYQSSVALEDDQRFENVNQEVDELLRSYIRYRGKNKLQLVGRRMNGETLNLVPRQGNCN